MKQSYLTAVLDIIDPCPLFFSVERIYLFFAELCENQTVMGDKDETLEAVLKEAVDLVRFKNKKHKTK